MVTFLAILPFLCPQQFCALAIDHGNAPFRSSHGLNVNHPFISIYSLRFSWYIYLITIYTKPRDIVPFMTTIWVKNNHDIQFAQGKQNGTVQSVYIEDWTKWAHSVNDIFKYIFLMYNLLISIWISLKLDPSVHNQLAFFKSWHRIVRKSLSEAMDSSCQYTDISITICFNQRCFQTNSANSSNDISWRCLWDGCHHRNTTLIFTMSLRYSASMS